MATHDPRSGGHDGRSLPRAVPFTLSRVTRTSWELGSRTVEGDDSSLYGEWERTDPQWTLSVHRVTSATVLIRVRTPTGRERFYGAAWMDLESALPEVTESPAWERTA